jgi:hypothetical protein
MFKLADRLKRHRWTDWDLDNPVCAFIWFVVDKNGYLLSWIFLNLLLNLKTNLSASPDTNLSINNSAIKSNHKHILLFCVIQVLKVSFAFA